MDEVDIDNMDDLNELEARLYAQIHHEPTNVEDNVSAGNKDDESNYEISSNTNRNLSKRYWTSTENDEIQPRQEQRQLLIRNPVKTPNQGNQRKVDKQSKHTGSATDNVLNPFKGKKEMNSAQNNNEINTGTPSITVVASTLSTTAMAAAMAPAPTPSVNTGNKKNKNFGSNYLIAKQKQPRQSKESNLKLNPIADWMKRKKNHINKKSNGKSSSVNVKQGLFSRQQQKLEKAKRFEEKKKRSKKAQNAAAVAANKLNPTEIIDLDTDNESDSSDVIVIPTAPPPTFTVDDSADEEEADKVNITIEHEENAVDSTDVQLSSTTASFIKPKVVSTQSLIAVDGDERRLENSSRCTSPCSIQSSDDFIRNIDRVRLSAGVRGVADDEDLLELTSDVNILAESSDISKPNDDEIVCVDKSKGPLNCNQQELQEQNVETSDTRDYRVDHSQFQALDVYESESDVTDSVYTKGTSKSTVIRQIDSSSDAVEDISICSQRTKRLRKRRASGSNKESDANNENLSSSSDNENIEDDNKVLRTAVPYIAKGLAVERYKPQKRSRTLSHSYSQKSKSPETPAASANFSDTEFLATLNNLAHGQDGEQEAQNESEESENEYVPTAREMAEKILSEHRETSTINESFTDDVALPNDILSNLDEVFETIDQLDIQNSNNSSSIDDAVKISDSSDSDREKHFIYPSVPNEVAQIIKYSPKNSAPKTHDENGSPIYNVIYSRGFRKPGGIGWNDEMQRFYNNSWNGEHFILSKVLQKMNPQKNLWKIYTEDRFYIKSNRRNNIKCSNCCELGHKRAKCTRPRRPLICYMCGESGHYEPRCPNTICLRCGNKTQVFTKMCNACSYQNRLTCPICKIRGHSLDYCPDKWRRYHSTTEANVQPSNKVDYNPRKYCCVCGARGHIADSCRSALRFSEYPPITSRIKSYQKSYSDVVVRTPYNGIAVNLMYEPCEEYKFDLVKQTSLIKYYGRFLQAVGLDFLLSRKRYSVPSENPESSAKKAKRLSKTYVANPYLKAAAVCQKKIGPMENAPNQVQEITESGSGNIDQHSDENRLEEGEEDVVCIEDEKQIEISDSDEEGATSNIQLNTINGISDENFKSPKVVTIAASEGTSTAQMEPSLVLDSDSNYSFSEHFDVAASSSGNDVVTTAANALESQTTEEPANNQEIAEQHLVAENGRPKAREMEALPDFIPLDSTEDQNEENNEIFNLNVGVSRKFVAAESDDDENMEDTRRHLSPLPELPCEAKIYLTHFHTKYLLSAQGNSFLVKNSRAHKLKARLDFTSVGHVLVIFGLPSNQDKFQRELLLKYRELEDEMNQRQVQSSINVPKRTFVLIKFLRENITQLMNNLGNVNCLLSRLQFLERQQTKSGVKSAEKVRRSLNMILVGQAGLQDGTMHLDKLLMSLKTLLNDVSGDIAPPELRSEIIDHWKAIFSAYRHENYQQLVDTYNKLMSKNRLLQLNIDPLLLGQKILDTNFSEEQKQKLMQVPSSTELPKQNLPNTLSQKNAKNSKGEQNTDALRADIGCSSSNIKKKSISNNTSVNAAAMPAKIKVASANSTSARTKIDEASKKQPQKHAGPPPLSNPVPEKRSTVSAAIQKVTDNWKSTCETLLNKISSPNPTNRKLIGKIQDSKFPSTFWSRKSMRYLNDCIRLAAARCEVVERLKRVLNKCKNGQLSYNDYLAVTQLHTTLKGK